MLSDFLFQKITQYLPFTPNDDQQQLIQELSRFLLSKENDEMFLLKGYAGTGKTSIIGALIKTLNELKQKTFLMAPTGRAAKVFTSYSDTQAYTIHKKIYRQKSITDFQFQLAENLHKHTLFIIDEASMISNGGMTDSIFGSGRLLDDLVNYIYTGEGCRMLLMGDNAQLPPIGQEESPALNANFIEGYSLKVYDYCLQTVARQSIDSGILHNATLIRKRIQNNDTLTAPKFETTNFPDIEHITGEDLIERLNQSYNDFGEENTIVITRSNKQALIYNKGIRHQVLQKEDELSAGDLLMIVKNNYFWGKNYEQFDFIANGEIVEVVRIRKHYDLYNLRFVDLTLRFLNYDFDIDTRILLDSIHAETPAAMEELNKKLFANVAEDYAYIGNKRERMKEITSNEFYNSLQVKFAYAITCHKAQGGQWDSVFIDQGYIGEEFGINYFHWMYTAITRATKKLYFINFPEDYFNQ